MDRNDQGCVKAGITRHVRLNKDKEELILKNTLYPDSGRNYMNVTKEWLEMY